MSGTAASAAGCRSARHHALDDLLRLVDAHYHDIRRSDVRAARDRGLLSPRCCSLVPQPCRFKKCTLQLRPNRVPTRGAFLREVCVWPAQGIGHARRRRAVHGLVLPTVRRAASVSGSPASSPERLRSATARTSSSAPTDASEPGPTSWRRRQSRHLSVGVEEENTVACFLATGSPAATGRRSYGASEDGAPEVIARSGQQAVARFRDCRDPPRIQPRMTDRAGKPRQSSCLPRCLDGARGAVRAQSAIARYVC